MVPKDTISAIATAPGNAGVAVIRISGPKSLPVLQKIFFPAKKTFLSHKMFLGKIKSKNGKTIDEVLVVYFKAPKSFTGEDCTEINCHGGFITAQKILKRILEEEVRLAEPGEFTKRAYLNGKIDLTQAEAVADIIYATSNRAQEIAQRQLEGLLGKKIKKILNNVLSVYSYLVMDIDFPDEEVPEVSQKKLAEKIAKALKGINALIESAQAGTIYKEGVKAAIIGLPNAGKSSLLNALVRDSKAIVTDIPGTTRDVLEGQIEIKGVLFKLFDTAGITDTEDRIEKEGVKRSFGALSGADIVLLVVEKYKDIEKFTKHLRKTAKKDFADKKIVIVKSKADAIKEKQPKDFKAPFVSVCEVSAKKNKGIKELEKILFNEIKGKDSSQNVFITSLRQKSLLLSAQTALLRVFENIIKEEAEDKILIDLDEAKRFLEEIIGQNIAENITEKVFSRFCVGK